ATVEMDAARASREATEARAKLAAAVGIPAGALEHAALCLQDLRAPQPPAPSAAEELRRRALRERPDVLAALADYASTEAELRGELAKQYPDLQLGPEFAWDQGQARWSLGVSLTLPLFNRHRGPIAEAETRRAASAA